MPLGAPPTVAAIESAALHVTLQPELLGRGTTVGFAIRIASPDGTPAGLTAFGISYPAELGIGLSGLGLATCQTQALQSSGSAACPNESVMGYGAAVAELPYGAELLPERMQVAIFRAPTENGRFELLIHAVGTNPTIAQLTFPGQLAPAPAPFGGQLQTTLPAVAGLPGGSGVAVVSFRAALGPLHVLYHERVRGRLISFHPRGIGLPERCPRAGFVFAAHLTFADGSHLNVRTAVPCPRPRRSRVQPRRHAHDALGGVPPSPRP